MHNIPIYDLISVLKFAKIDTLVFEIILNSCQQYFIISSKNTKKARKEEQIVHRLYKQALLNLDCYFNLNFVVLVKFLVCCKYFRNYQVYDKKVQKVHRLYI